MDGKELIHYKDKHIRSGKVALLADNPAEFGPVAVEGTLERKKQPPLPICASPKLVYEIDLPPTKSKDRSQVYF